MWQLSWILSLIPEWILVTLIHGTVVVGLVLTFCGGLLKFIPVINPYAAIAKQIGIVLLVIGVFFEGGLAVEQSYRVRIAEMQAKIKEAEIQSVKLNEKLTVEVSKNKELIKEKVNKNAKDIEAKREAINAECKLSDDAWVLYNRAVEPKVSRGPSSANGARSGSKASK
jgi:membrane-bound ClpP family serine protease